MSVSGLVLYEDYECSELGLGVTPESCRGFESLIII